MIAVEWFHLQKRPCRWDALAGAGLSVWLVAWVWPLVPFAHRLLPPCNFLRLTGWPCGTCGFTRAFTAAARLRVGEAFSFSPLGAALFYGLAVASLWVLAARLAPRLPLPRFRFPAGIARWVPLCLFAANWAFVILRHWADGA